MGYKHLTRLQPDRSQFKKKSGPNSLRTNGIEIKGGKKEIIIEHVNKGWTLIFYLICPSQLPQPHFD